MDLLRSEEVTKKYPNQDIAKGELMRRAYLLRGNLTLAKKLLRTARPLAEVLSSMAGKLSSRFVFHFISSALLFADPAKASISEPKFDLGSSASPVEATQCSGPHQNEKINRARLQRLLQSRKSIKEVLNLCQADLRQADLSGMELSMVNLQKANLSGANLQFATIIDSSMSDVALANVNLHGTVFRKVKFSSANFSKAFLDKTTFIEADLSGALFSGMLNSVSFIRSHLIRTRFLDLTATGLRMENAILRDTQFLSLKLTTGHFINCEILADFNNSAISNVSFRGSNLTDSRFKSSTLFDVDLSKTNLTRTDFAGATLKDVDLTEAITAATNLSDTNLTITPGTFPPNLWLGSVIIGGELITSSPSILLSMKQAFKESGRRDAERKATYLIEKRETEMLLHGSAVDIFSGVMRKIGFEFPVRYGQTPTRALLLLIMLIPLFASAYYAALAGRYSSNIYRCWSKDSLLPQRATQEELLPKGKTRLLIALHFSVASAFQIGWKEINVGNWISRLQTQDYTLNSTGWVRTLSGLQSLTSVYLLAMWALTQFGRPFD